MECEECEYDSDQDNNSPQTSFMDLNDHCLLKVFDYLPLLDMINISLTCKRLTAVSQMVAKNFKQFCMDKYADAVIKRENQLPTTLLINRAMEYISPIVESITTISYGSLLEDNHQLKTLEKYDFPKLKSLSLKKSKQLAWIKSKRNVEKLAIQMLERGDLNNYACGMTRVKKLSLRKIRTCVPISELLYFFENNPNIECLKIIEDYGRKLPENFFTKLKNLKILEFTMGDNIGDLLYALQIENLTELILKYEPNGYLHNHNNIELANSEADSTAATFLTSMASKQTLKTLDLRNVYFDDLVDSLAPLNLVSFRYCAPSNFTFFYSKLATTPFPTLKRFDIVAPVDIGTLFALIKNLTGLEEMSFSMMRPYRKQVLLEHLTQLLSGGKQPNRPDLRIDFLIMPFTIKVSEFEAN